jgi:lipopolysaccharide biosynthesis glycosyltransferase
MKKALITYADNSQSDIDQISLPFKQYYADAFGYQLINQPELPKHDRTPNWSKILLLQEALSEYDQVLWLDADTMPVRFDEDIFSHMDANRSVGVVLEREIGGAGTLILE